MEERERKTSNCKHQLATVPLRSNVQCHIYLTPCVCVAQELLKVCSGPDLATPRSHSIGGSFFVDDVLQLDVPPYKN